MWRHVGIAELCIISNAMPVIGEIVITCITMMDAPLHLQMVVRNGMHNLPVTIHAVRLMKQSQIVDFMMAICIFRIGEETTLAIV